MAIRQAIFSGSPWEEAVGYARVVRIGNRVEVAGTTAMRDGQVIGVGDPYAQTVRCLQTIEESLRKVGATTADVVRTRMFVTDITRWEEIARAHREFFAAVRPVATMVEVRALIAPELLVEIEAEAEIANEASRP